MYIKLDQASVLSPLLFILLIYNCAAMSSLNHTIKFFNEMTLVDHISKTANRKEMQLLSPVDLEVATQS